VSPTSAPARQLRVRGCQVVPDLPQGAIPPPVRAPRPRPRPCVIPSHGVVHRQRGGELAGHVRRRRHCIEPLEGIRDHGKKEKVRKEINSDSRFVSPLADRSSILQRGIAPCTGRSGDHGRREDTDCWPGFVDALGNTINAMVFVVIVRAESLSMYAVLLAHRLSG